MEGSFGLQTDDAGLLKRQAPGQPSGYYSQRFYHSLPHHYKLPFPKTHSLKENTLPIFPGEFSRKLTAIMKWFKEFNNEQKNQVCPLYDCYVVWRLVSITLFYSLLGFAMDGEEIKVICLHWLSPGTLSLCIDKSLVIFYASFF